MAILTLPSIKRDVDHNFDAGAGMTKSAQKRTNIFGFLSILALSSATMLLMLWHFPVGTGIATILVLSAFGVSPVARLARSIESEDWADLDRGKPGRLSPAPGPGAGV